MQSYYSKIDEYVAQHLSLLECFARPDDTHVLSKSFLREDESLHGLYMNNEDDFVLFSDLAVHRVKGDKVRTIAYEGIREVDLPKDPAQRALYVHMRCGDTFLLPIINETDEYPDFVAVRYFLLALIYDPHFSENPQDIEKIRTREHLKAFLDYQQCGERHQDLTQCLTNGFPQPWQLDLFKIDPQLLQTPDVWRLLALFLSRSPASRDYAFEVDRTGIQASQDIIRAIERGKPLMNYDDEGNEIDPPPLGEVEIDSLEVPPEILNAMTEEAANLVEFAIGDCNHGMLTDAGLLLALVAFDGKLASMILERKDLTVGAIRKDISLRMGKQRTYFSNLVRSNASAIKILEKAKELSLEKKNKQITPEIILYAMNDSNDAWVNLVLSSFQRSW
jgi:hypothetical protein